MFDPANFRSRVYDIMLPAIDENFRELITRHEALVSEALVLFEQSKAAGDITAKEAMAVSRLADLVKKLMQVNYPDGYTDLFPNEGA